MNQVVTTFSGLPENEIRAAIEKSSLAKIVSDTMGRERFIEAALAVIRQPGMADCTQESILGGLLKAALFNFRVSPELGQCWLVPRNVKVGERDSKPVYAKVATFQIGYRGWQELAMRSGDVESFDRGVVRMRDTFEFEQGTSPFLKFRPHQVQGERGPITYVWASATMRSGRVVFDVQPVEEIERHRRMSDTQNEWKDGKKVAASGPVGIWAQHYDAMAARIPMSYLCKLKLPKSEELRQAIEADGSVNNLAPEGKIIQIGQKEVEESAPAFLHEDYILEIENCKTKEQLRALWDQRRNELEGDAKQKYYDAVSKAGLKLAE